MCVAAKFSLDHYDIRMLSDNDWSERVIGLFDILYPNGINVEFEVALECNSFPKMFLHKPAMHSNTVGGKSIVMVMLIENEIDASRHGKDNATSSEENFISASTCFGPDCA